MLQGVVRCAPVVCALLLMLPGAARAEDYPAKTIKIIVPNPPGGAGDISARLIGQKLGEKFAQPVVIENEAGASGSIGMNMLKRAAPDGYTIGVVIALAQTIDRIQNKNGSFDLVKDFTPITAIADNPAGLLVNAQIKAATMADFIADVRGRPGQIPYGTAGIGTAHHLYGEVLKNKAGIDMVNVPYKGVAPAFNDLLGGHVPVAIVSLATALPHVQAGTVRALTIFDHKRYAKLPDVPTIAEVLPSFEPGRAWVGVLGPAGLPPAIATRLHGAIVEALKAPDVLAVMGENGLEVIANTPAEFDTMIRHDTEIWDGAAALAGLIKR